MSRLYLLFEKTLHASWIGGGTIGAYIKARDNIKNESVLMDKILWGAIGTFYGGFLGASVAPMIVFTLPITIPAYLTQ